MRRNATAIRGASVGDARELARLAAQALPGGWDEEGFDAELRRPDALLWCARSREAGAAVQGALAARRAVDEIDLLWLAVAPGARRSGVARRLLDVLLAEADRRGDTVCLEVRIDNRAAVALYRSAGFVVTGRRPRYYRDGEDALRMSRPPPPVRPPSGRHEEHVLGSALPLRIDATVVRNESDAGPSLWRLWLDCPGWPGFEPGQFAMLSAGAVTDVRRSDPLLPRPMAIYRTRPVRDGARVEILYKLHGRGTALLAEALPGQRVRLVGPLGTPFPMPPRDDACARLLVGGGTGVASLYELAARLQGAAGATRVLLGARSACDLMGRSDFEALGVDLRIATQDGTAGTRGQVTELLEAAIRELPDAFVYVCGPTAMMRACADITAGRARRCVVSLENRMACGFGVCLGCAAPLSDGGYALVCRRGPVFDAAAVDWDGLP